MGTIKKGILGGFNGRVGNVIGGSWKGVSYMRSEAQTIKNPRTVAQQENRSLFGSVSDLMSKANSVIKFGYQLSAVKKSPFNCAVQENVKIFTEAGSEMRLGKVVFSKGGLQPIVTGTASKSGDTLNITGNLAAALLSPKTAYCIAIFEGDFAGAPFVSTKSASLATEDDDFTAVITAPSGVTYTNAYVHAFLYDPQTKEASDTTYIGVVAGS